MLEKRKMDRKVRMLFGVRIVSLPDSPQKTILLVANI